MNSIFLLTSLCFDVLLFTFIGFYLWSQFLYDSEPVTRLIFNQMKIENLVHVQRL